MFQWQCYKWFWSWLPLWTATCLHSVLVLTPTCWKSNTTNATLMAFAPSLALDPTFGIHSHKTLDTAQPKLQTLVYDILPSITAIFSYAIGSRKLSANEQFSVGAQTVVSLLQLIQITQIISDVWFIIDHDAYTSSNKTKIVWIETELFFYPGWMCLMFMCVLGLLQSH